MMNIYNIKPDYERAGISCEGKNAKLYDYTLNISQEMGFHRRPAVIICPGGGYKFLSDREGQATAMRFSSYGINAFVLKYSVCTPFPTSLLEIAETIKFVRENADKFDIDPQKILVCGFSAGGHLAASIGTLWNSEYLKNILGDTQIYKPDGMILSYPVITSGKFCHKGSMDIIIGENPSHEMSELVSLEKNIDENTPKTFIWHCSDDKTVPVENTISFINELSKSNVSFESHIFPHGGHGLALADCSTASRESHINTTCATWFNLAVDWIMREF